MVFRGFWLVSMVFQGGFMVFHGFWLVFMVFHGGFMVFHGFWLVSMGFRGGFMVFMVSVGCLHELQLLETQLLAREATPAEQIAALTRLSTLEVNCSFFHF